MMLKSQRVGLILIALYLASIIILPTGTFFGINLKAIFTLFLFLGFFIRIMMKRNLKRETVYFFIYITFFICITIIFLLNGAIINANSFAFREFSDFMSALLVLISIFLIRHLGIANIEEMINILFYSAAVYSLAKVALFILIYIGMIDYNYTMDLIENVFRITPVRYNYGDGISRIQISNDTSLPYILFLKILVSLPKKFSFFDIFISIIIFFSIIVSFTRYYWLAGLLAVIIPMAFYYFSNKSLASKIILTLSISVMSVLVSNLVSNNTSFKSALNERLSGASTQASDVTRGEQAFYLNEEFRKRPFFGKGLGGSVSGYTRSEFIPYAYEIQWLGYLMKFGILGTALLLFFIIIPIIRKEAFDLYNLQVLIMYLVWILSGFFNPNLVSTIGGCIFGIFLIILTSKDWLIGGKYDY